MKMVMAPQAWALAGRWRAAMRDRFAAGALVLVLAVLLSFAAGGTAGATDKPLIELFTSQGCSSCPPADKVLKQYIERKNVIALSYSVDYWDYLGWKDTLASPEFTRRQRDYALTRGDRQVYTPQVVVNGMEHVVGSRPEAIDAAIRKTSKALAGKRVPMRLWSEGRTLFVFAGAAAKGAEKMSGTIWLALTRRKTRVAVRGGENASRTLDYHNVVRELVPVGMWEGKAVTLKLPRHDWMKRGSDGCTVFLQLSRTGPVLGAAEMTHW